MPKIIHVPYSETNEKHVRPKTRTAYPGFFPRVGWIFHEYDMSSRQIQSPQRWFFTRHSIYQADILNLEKFEENQKIQSQNIQ